MARARGWSKRTRSWRNFSSLQEAISIGCVKVALIATCFISVVQAYGHSLPQQRRLDVFIEQAEDLVCHTGRELHIHKEVEPRMVLEIRALSRVSSIQP